MAVAGKVAITPKGLYVTGNTYDRLDMESIQEYLEEQLQGIEGFTIIS